MTKKKSGVITVSLRVRALSALFCSLRHFARSKQRYWNRRCASGSLADGRLKPRCACARAIDRRIEGFKVACGGRVGFGPPPSSISYIPSSHSFVSPRSFFLHYRFLPCKSRMRKLDYVRAPPSSPQSVPFAFHANICMSDLIANR